MAVVDDAGTKQMDPGHRDVGPSAQIYTRRGIRSTIGDGVLKSENSRPKQSQIIDREVSVDAVRVADLVVQPYARLIGVPLALRARDVVVAGEAARDTFLVPIRIGKRIESKNIISHRIDTIAVHNAAVDAVRKLCKLGNGRRSRHGT